ncbi:hypothetical protein Landi51_06141 [Colletotrichum acutatum]
MEDPKAGQARDEVGKACVIYQLPSARDTKLFLRDKVVSICGDRLVVPVDEAGGDASEQDDHGMAPPKYLTYTSQWLTGTTPRTPIGIKYSYGLDGLKLSNEVIEVGRIRLKWCLPNSWSKNANALSLKPPLS